MRFACVFLFLVSGSISAQPLKGTAPLNAKGDLALEMVEGIKRALLKRTASSVQSRKPDRERLRLNLGVVDDRVRFTEPELSGTLHRNPLLRDTGAFKVYTVRWPVVQGVWAEGLLLEPSVPVARIVALPDSFQSPEEFLPAQILAGAGCQVLVPVLLNRDDADSGTPGIRMTNQSSREFLYRMAFPVGRHPIGYEIQTVMAAIDWFNRQSRRLPVGVYGQGEGGAIALYTAALDPRVQAAVVGGYFGNREELWKQPLYRNIWGILKDFGDAEVASLIAPRTLIIDRHTPAPEVAGPIPESAGRRGAAPGVLSKIADHSVNAELTRARLLVPAKSFVSAGADPLRDLLAALEVRREPGTVISRLGNTEIAARHKRIFTSWIAFTQSLVEESEKVRERLFADYGSAVRQRFWNEVLGKLDPPLLQPTAQTRKTSEGKRWTAYEVKLDLDSDLFAYGVLLVPKSGGRHPAVVLQHGLNGRPQDLYSQPEGRTKEVYRNIAETLVDKGFVVYAPQNPYIHDFRPISRLANPLGLSLFSVILAQYEPMLNWLESQPFVERGKIGFYGLSYGGKTALRVPALLPRFAAVVCSGDFNEWIRKLTSLREPYSYMFTPEYEILEWNMAHIASHAELSMLQAPHPFLVERGHRDGVGIDEWVAYEFAKVQRLYDEKGWGDRAGIAWFNGPHRIDGAVSVPFLKKWLTGK